MEYHILNGDALAGKFPPLIGRESQLVIMREALIDGNLDGINREEFWRNRASHHETTLEEYREKVVTGIEKMLATPPDATLNFWFGYDLFCQVNLWFLLSLIKDAAAGNIYVVYPVFLEREAWWQEFGKANDEQLIYCFNNRTRATSKDLELGAKLWSAYKNNDLAHLEQLSFTPSSCFPSLQLVCRAHIERFPGETGPGRPEQVVEDILRTSAKDFYSVFSKFFEREGIYGFGDVQFKKIYDRVVNAGS